MKKDKKTQKKLDSKERQTLIRLRDTMRWQLMLFVLSIMIVSAVLTVLISFVVLILFGWLPALVAIRLNPIFFVGVLFVVCAMISAPLSAFFGKYYLRPIKELSAATKEVKKGNFDVRVPIDLDVHDRPKTEMDVLISDFNEMVGELGGIEIFRNDFINNFSHEFKTPIVSIRGFAKELQFSDLSDEQRQEYAKIIAEESDRLAKLSISVLELSKLENQQIVSDKTEFYLDEQLRQCILLQESSWSGKGIDMIPELEEVRFFGNEEMLNRVWSNLIGNAVKFTPEGGMIAVRLKVEEDEVVVSVADTGIGMTEETKRHIFEKFYQGEKSHTHAGYGIGLTVVSRVVKLCGGRIDVESTPGEGSTFTVRLPRQ